MPRYSEEDIQRVIESNDIVDVISEHISLKRAGANYKALCPFHNEKTPSFMVSPSKQIYHCFGCGEGGNVIGFIMKHLNYDFPEALELLADRTGIELQRKETKEKEYETIANKRDRLHSLNREAARFFYSNLRNSTLSYRYLLSRGLNEQTIRAFGLGYSLDKWESLLPYLKTKGYSEEELAEVGLIIKRKKSNGYYDRFRKRIMFPIIDVKGNVIGFGGRVLDDTQPKYLNSPDSSVFSKGDNLYNLNLARKYSKGKNIILVEGYMDVISLYSHGVYNCVASLGTALTPQQAKLLKRYSNKYYICYDSDIAGLNATNKAFDILKDLELDARAIILPSGKDPDDFIKENGKEAFNELMNKSLNFINFKIHYYKTLYDISTIEGKIEFTKEIAKTLKEIKSPVEVDAYIKRIASETNISLEAINKEVYGSSVYYSRKTNAKDKYISSKYRNNNKDKIIPVKHNLEPGHLIAERSLLYLIINDKQVFDEIKDSLKPSDFLNSLNREIAATVYEIYENEGEMNEEYIINAVKDENIDQVNSILNLNIQMDSKERKKAVEDFIRKIRHYSLKIKKNEIKREILKLTSNKENIEGDEDTFKQLCLELTKIERELKFHR